MESLGQVFEFLESQTQSSPQAAFSVVLLATVTYLPLVYFDLKYRKLAYWHIASWVAVYFAAIASYYFLVDEPQFAASFLASIPVWFALSYFCGEVNDEKYVGKADVDVALSQLVVALLDFNHSSSDTEYVAHSLKCYAASLFVGAVLAFLAWYVQVVSHKISKKPEGSYATTLPVLAVFSVLIPVNTYLAVSFVSINQ